MKSSIQLRRKLYIISLYLVGLAGTCVGVSICLKTTMGIDAWNASIAGLSGITPVSIGAWTIIIHLIFLIISTLIDKKFQWRCIVPVLFKGIVLDMVKPLIDKMEFSDNTLSLFMWFLVGYFIISIFTGIYISTKYPRMPVDGLMFSLANFLHKDIKHSRLIVEIIGFVVMFAVDGAFGVGTVIMTLTCGYMFSACKNISEKTLLTKIKIE